MNANPTPAEAPSDAVDDDLNKTITVSLIKKTPPPTDPEDTYTLEFKPDEVMFKAKSGVQCQLTLGIDKKDEFMTFQAKPDGTPLYEIADPSTVTDACFPDPSRKTILMQFSFPPLLLVQGLMVHVEVSDPTDGNASGTRQLKADPQVGNAPPGQG